MQEQYIDNMIKNLPLLRAAMGLTQERLGSKLGISRQTIVAIENQKNPLTRSLYLAIVLIFKADKTTNKLLYDLKIFHDGLI